MTILDQIIADKRKEVELRKALIPVEVLQTQSLFGRPTLSLKNALQTSLSGIIAEFKRKSPSKGWIHEDAVAAEIAKGYADAGASGISVLTDTNYFGGTSHDLIQVREQVNVPLLRKDFVIDDYQLYEAKAMGADVILLIAAALSPEQTLSLAQTARSLSLEVLLEIHHADELLHINEYVDMVGVNNRNLKTFEVDIQSSVDLVEAIPSSFVKVSESGLKSPETVKMLQQLGYQGFLMGENFMKEPQPALALHHFIRDLTV